MKSIGIIPAAGKAKRFGGTLKELLPAYDGISFANHAVNHLRQVCDLVVVVTNKEKVQAHMENIKGVVFTEQQNELDILGAIQAGMMIDAGRYFMLMPDTFITGNVFRECPTEKDLSLGLFITNKKGRFGYIVNNSLLDKSIDIDTPAQAWGALSWSYKIKKTFFSFTNLPDVLNKILISGDFDTWKIGDYFDMADVKEYAEYMEFSSRIKNIIPWRRDE